MSDYDTEAVLKRQRVRLLSQVGRAGHATAVETYEAETDLNAAIQEITKLKGWISSSGPYS